MSLGRHHYQAVPDQTGTWWCERCGDIVRSDAKPALGLFMGQCPVVAGATLER